LSEKKKSFLKGAAILAAGSIIAKVLGIFIKIPLDGILGSFGSGLYSNAYPLYTALLSISVIGPPVAISKMVSERMTFGNYQGAYKVFKVAICTLAVLGGFCSLIMLLGANIFISAFKWHPQTYYSVLGLSLAPLFVSLQSTFRGFFQGMQKMIYPSVSQIIESFARVVFGLGLCILFMKIIGVGAAAGGATFGATAGAILGSVYLYFCFIANKKNHKEAMLAQTHEDEEPYSSILSTLIKMTIPITLASFVTSAMSLIDTMTVSGCMQSAGYTVEQATELWGLLSIRAQTLVNVPLTLGAALSASLVPSISESFARRDRNQVQQKSYTGILVAFVVAFPCAVGLCVLAGPIISLLYGTPDGAGMLAVLAYSIIFALTMTTLQGILQGVGKFFIPVKNLAIGCVIKLLFNIVLISNPQVNIYGAILGTIVADCCVSILCINAVKKYIGLKPGLGFKIFKTALCSGLMGIGTYLSYHLMVAFLPGKVATLISILLSMAAYFALLFILRVIDKEFINEFRRK